MKFLPLATFMILGHAALALQPSNDSLIFVTTDLERFWNAFDHFTADTTQNPFAEYLAGGTPQLREFLLFPSEEAPGLLKRRVAQDLAYYNAVRPHTGKVEEHRHAIMRLFKRFRDIYPAAELPVVTFVVGATYRGGTATDEGAIIGIEKFGDSTAVTSYGSRALSPAILPVVVANTIVFYNQKPAHTGYTLLRQAIIAGSADFILTLILDGEKHHVLGRKSYVYGESHEQELVREFLRRRNDADMSGWFDYGNTGGRPSDLAFWMGYRITEGYYNNHPDKQKAVDEILKINDFERFLQLSGIPLLFGE